MANTFDRVTGEASTTGTTIYTVPAGEVLTIVGCRLSNKSDAPVNTHVTVNGNYISGKDTPIPVSSALDIMDGSKIVVTEGDVVKAHSDIDNSVDVHLSFMRQN